MTYPQNPFEVLRIDPSATEEEIVRQAGRLRQRAAGESELNAIRQAVQELTAKPEERRLLALMAHPQPSYSTPALDRFVAAFRRPPATEAATTAFANLDLDEVRELLRDNIREEAKPGLTPFEALPPAMDAEELRKQAAEANWQSLLADMRA